MDKLESLKNKMDSFLRRAEGFSLSKKKDSFSIKEKEIFNYGYGEALKDVLENFFLEEKVNLITVKKDINKIIDKIKSDFPSCVVSFDDVSNNVPEYMAHLSMDVYMLEEKDLLKFEDVCDELSLEFYKNTNFTIVILSHTVENTRVFYPQKILEK